MNEYELSNEITVITNATRDMLLDKNIDALVLYLFYTKGTNHQKSNSIWITDEFAMKGLKWGRERVVKAKNFLIDNNLIELKKQRFENGTYGKTFVVVKYLWKQENKDLLIERDCIQLYQNPQVVTTEGGFQETNALSNYKLNALSNKNKMLKVSEKEKNSKTSNLEQELTDFITHFNIVYEKNYRVPSGEKGWVKNYKKWSADYSLEQMKEAVTKSKLDNFYCDKLTPDMFFRTNEDRIDRFLQLQVKPKKSYLDTIREEYPDVIIAQ